MDVVIDFVVGSTWTALLKVLKPFGINAVTGAIAGHLVELDAKTLYIKDLSFFAYTVLGPQVFRNLVKRIEAKQVTPLVAQTYPLEKTTEAQIDFEKKEHVGNLVIDLS